MPILRAHNLGFTFDNGDTLFSQLNCALTHKRTGLVGKNGAGKSILAQLLAKRRPPSAGHVDLTVSVCVYTQHHDIANDTTIAEYLGYSKVFKAIQAIEQGHCELELFDTVAEQWHLPAQLSAQLETLGLKGDSGQACQQLSGGQLARLRLWHAFNSQAKLLILDEPSNHLDAAGRTWLSQQIEQFHGNILVISHDHSLLKNVEQIWQLSDLGLKQYGGNIDHYLVQSQLEQQAVSKHLNEVKRQQAQLKKQAQENKEKAQQRAKQGEKLQKTGSQPKILLNKLKDNASANMASKNKSQQLREAQLSQKHLALKKKQQAHSNQALHINQYPTDVSKKTLLNVQQLILAYGTHSALSFKVEHRQKWLIQGLNGSGKSTLLNTLLGTQKALSGSFAINTPLSYLNQHFNQIIDTQSSAEHLQRYCPHLSQSDIFTLLAGIGIKHSNATHPAQNLSGGEKIKLTLLCAAHQQPTPLLLLDEPDNHLDFESKILLASTLSHYKGSFLLVSHDDYFVKQCGVTHHLNLEGSKSVKGVDG